MLCLKLKNTCNLSIANQKDHPHVAMDEHPFNISIVGVYNFNVPFSGDNDLIELFIKLQSGGCVVFIQTHLSLFRLIILIVNPSSGGYKAFLLSQF